VTATTTTTIRGVSIFSRQRTRKADLFDIALSTAGIAILRPGQSEQHMTWERIEQWEIQERPGCVVLTLRGGGSVTPLMVKGWSLENLETVMREATTGATDPSPPAPVTSEAVASEAVASEAVASEAVTSEAVEPEAVEPEAVEPEAAPSAPVPRATRRQAARPPRRSTWRVFVTVVLLGALATAVTLVLLQSAGVISWSFLGPVA
jgi:hypothetical protein